MTPQEVITEARVLLNDQEATPRYSDGALLVYVNDWAKQLARSVPRAFYVSQSLALTAGSDSQEVSRSTTLGLVDVLRMSTGERVRRVPQDQIEDHLRFGYAIGSNEPEMWCPVDGDNWRFMVYPKPTSALQVSAVVRGDPTELLMAYGSKAVADSGGALPALYNADLQINMVANSPVQSVSRTTTFGVVDVSTNALGARVMRTERALIEELIRYGNATEPMVWCPVEGDPWRFRVWPAPTSAHTLKVVLAPNNALVSDEVGFLAGADPQARVWGAMPVHNTTTTITLTANAAHQEVSRTKTRGVVDVLANGSGVAMRKVTPSQMDDLLLSSRQGSPCLWCPIEGDAWRFMVWPIPTSAATLNVVVQSRKDELMTSFGQAYMKSNNIEMPALMNRAQTLTLTSGSYWQEASRTTTMGVVDVTATASGRPLRRVSREYIDDMMRNTFPASGTPALWAPDAADPWRFLVHPRPASALTMSVIVVSKPADVAIGAQMVPGDEYRASAASYVAGRALMANTSVADAPRAKLLLELSASMASTTGVASAA